MQATVILQRRSSIHHADDADDDVCRRRPHWKGFPGRETTVVQRPSACVERCWSGIMQMGGDLLTG